MARPKLLDKIYGLTPDVIGAASNPNLLDNWYFVRPINQKGQTTYLGTSGYTFDRWHFGTTTKVELLENGIKFTNTYADGASYGRQYLNPPLRAGTYTLSVLASEVIGNARFYFSDNEGNTVNSSSLYVKAGLTSITKTFTENQIYRI